jgi:hypothetical protein
VKPAILIVVLKPETAAAQARGLMHAFRTYPGVAEVLPAESDEIAEVARLLEMVQPVVVD